MTGAVLIPLDVEEGDIHPSADHEGQPTSEETSPAMTKEFATTKVCSPSVTIAPVTPDKSSLEDCGTRSDLPVPDTNESLKLEKEQLLSEMQIARADAEQAADALEKVMEGVRAVKRVLLARSVTGESNTNEEAGHDTVDVSQDIHLVHDLADQLHGVLGSELLSLINAVSMVQQREKLVEEESTTLINDLSHAKKQAELSSVEAKQAKKLTRTLYRENRQLHEKVENLQRDRKTLVKEVKELRKDVEETRKLDSWRMLEGHMLESLAVHETLMRTPVTPKENIFHEDPTSALKEKELESVPATPSTEEEPEEPQRRFGRGFAGFRGAFAGGWRRSPKNGEEEENPESHAMDAPKTNETNTSTEPESQSCVPRDSRSPTPSQDEVSTITDTSDEGRISGDKPAKTISSHPRNLRVDTEIRENTSPMVSPVHTPSVATPRPFFNAQILRTLAIPSDAYATPSRKSEKGNLYEC